MTQAETLTKAREITRGSTCFVIASHGRYQVFRRVPGRVVPLGYRTDPDQLCSWLRKLTNH